MVIINNFISNNKIILEFTFFFNLDIKNANESEIAKDVGEDIQLISEKKENNVRESVIREQLNVKNCLEIKSAVLEKLDLTRAEYLNRIDPMTSPGTERELTTMVIKFIFEKIGLNLNNF